MNKIDFSALMQPEYTEVEVPELGGTIRIKKMQAREYLEVEKFYMTQGEIRKDKDGQDIFTVYPTNVEALFVRLCVVDDDNKPVFDEQTVWQLGKQAISAINNAINRHTNQATQEEVADTAKK